MFVGILINHLHVLRRGCLDAEAAERRQRVEEEVRDERRQHAESLAQVSSQAAALGVQVAEVMSDDVEDELFDLDVNEEEYEAATD